MRTVETRSVTGGLVCAMMDDLFDVLKREKVGADGRPGQGTTGSHRSRPPRRRMRGAGGEAGRTGRRLARGWRGRGPERKPAGHDEALARRDAGAPAADPGVLERRS